MNSNQLNQAKLLFEEVINLTQSGAKSYLDKNCFDREVRTEVEILLHNFRTGEHSMRHNETVETGTIQDTAEHLELSRSPKETHFADLRGKTFNNTYFIQEQIGQGGMGLVFSARHLLLGNEVAIKVLPPTLKKNATDIKRFQREARVGWSLSHPNIVKVFELSQTQDQTLFIVMELVKGENLKNSIKRASPFSPSRCLEILKPLCSALAIAHKNNVLHRDLKPANVLISKENGEELIKLADFGIAKLLRGDDGATQGTVLTTEGTIIGSLDYMSPEQFMDYKLTPASDIYSLGVILHEMLTGELPVYGSSPQEILKLKTSYHKDPPLSQKYDFIAPVFDEVLKKVLSPVPYQRYQKTEDLLSAFQGCVG
jgi:serine/threonine-protein kinase